MVRQCDNSNSLLAEYIASKNNTPFEWGVFDCCIFASECVKIKTGLDLYADYRGKYNDEASAQTVQKQIGYIEEVLDKHFERISVDFIRRGDVVMFENGVMGIYYNGYFSTGKNGVGVVNHKVKEVWALWQKRF